MTLDPREPGASENFTAPSSADAANEEQAARPPALTRAQLYRRLWRRAKFYWKAAAGFILSFVSVCTVVFIIVLLAHELSQHSVSIESISVPESLSKAGYTPAVASQKLYDAIGDIGRASNSNMKRQTLALSTERSDIVLPTVGLSLNTVATAILSFFHSDAHKKISGEFTSSKKRLWLTLRLNQDVLFVNKKGGDPRDPDSLIAAAAQAVLRKTDPYIVASALFGKNKLAAFEETESIIDRLPENDQNVVRAYNLRGLIYEDQRRFSLATDNFNKASALDSSFALGHYNLSRVYERLGNLATAETEVDKAIAIDPGYADCYYLRGEIHARRQQWDEAHSDYGTAIRLNDKDSFSYYADGQAFYAQRDYGKAASQIRRAIKLRNPVEPYYHNSLGNALLGQSKFREAIEEYQKALSMDRLQWAPYINLANSLAAYTTLQTPHKIAVKRMVSACKLLHVGYALHREAAWLGAAFRINEVMSRLGSPPCVLRPAKARNGEREV